MFSDREDIDDSIPHSLPMVRARTAVFLLGCSSSLLHDLRFAKFSSNSINPALAILLSSYYLKLLLLVRSLISIDISYKL